MSRRRADPKGVSYVRVTIRVVSKTLTIRLPDSQDKALATRAEALGVTRSELVRHLIDRGLDEQPLARNIGHLKGRGIGVLITDHNVRETLGICDHAYIISDGNVLAQGTPSEIVNNADVRRVYLGEHFRM